MLGSAGARALITVGDVALEPPDCALWTPTIFCAPPRRRCCATNPASRPCATTDGFIGVVYVEAVLQCVADDRTVPSVAQVLSTQIPTCERRSSLVDAVRQMIACYLRKIPVVGDAGELIGLLTLSEAAAAGARDPAVAEVIERFAGSPSLFARRLR